jgi:hypothetical protein
MTETLEAGNDSGAFAGGGRNKPAQGTVSPACPSNREGQIVHFIEKKAGRKRLGKT